MTILNVSGLQSRVMMPKLAVKAPVASFISGTDRVEIRFGAQKSTVTPKALEAARVATAELLGVPVSKGKVDLETLRQAFVTGYYTFVAQGVAESDFEDGGESLDQVLGDMNLGSDDYCSGSSLLKYALYDIDGVDSEDVDDLTEAEVLGYKDYDAYTADLPRLLPEFVKNFGLNPSELTDSGVIRALGDLGSEKLTAKLAEQASAAAAAALESAIVKGNTFVVTGTIDGMSRKDVEAAITQRGGKLGGSVTKNTNYLVVGADAGASKIADAESKGIPSIDEAAFKALLAKSPLEGAEPENKSAKKAPIIGVKTRPAIGSAFKKPADGQ